MGTLNEIIETISRLFCVGFSRSKFISTFTIPPFASGKCAHNPCLKGECAKTVTEKDCFAHLFTNETGHYERLPVNVYIRPPSHFSRNTYTVTDITIR
jgi:capsid portal protein